MVVNRARGVDEELEKREGSNVGVKSWAREGLLL
jgi:hypothetical protein